MIKRISFNPFSLYGFHNTETISSKSQSNRTVFGFKGSLDISEQERICPHCHCKMHIYAKHNTHLTHLNFGITTVCVPVMQLRYPVCSKTKCQNIPFKAEDHMITKSLLVYIHELLSTGAYTNKEIAKNVGLSENTIKKIELKQPEKQPKYPGIDELNYTLVTDMQRI
jgi:hypothetical protein